MKTAHTVILVFGFIAAGDCRNTTFLAGTENGLMLFHSNSTNDILWKTNDSVRTVDYDLEQGLVFYYSSGDLYGVKLDNKSSNFTSALPTHLAKLGKCEGFAVDWVNNNIYWMNYTHNNTLVRMDLLGKNVKSILKIAGNQADVTKMVVDPEVRRVFWVGGKELSSCDMDGKDLRNHTPKDQPVKTVALDILKKRVLFVGGKANSFHIYQMNYSNGFDKPIRQKELNYYDIVDMSVVNDTVFILDKKLDATDRDVYEITEKMTRQPKSVRNIESVYSLSILDPELQKRAGNNDKPPSPSSGRVPGRVTDKPSSSSSERVPGRVTDKPSSSSSGLVPGFVTVVLAFLLADTLVY